VHSGCACLFYLAAQVLESGQFDAWPVHVDKAINHPPVPTIALNPVQQIIWTVGRLWYNPVDQEDEVTFVFRWWLVSNYIATLKIQLLTKHVREGGG